MDSITRSSPARLWGGKYIARTRETQSDDNYSYHENTRQIIGARSKKTYSIGDKVRVIVDRIDHMQRKVQFAVMEEQKPKRAEKRHKKKRG